MRIGPKDIRKPVFQVLVALELGLDLAKELLGNRTGMAKQTDRDFIIDNRIIAMRREHVLNGQGECDDRRLVMFTSPEI
jgi:hypothetical protein